MVRGNMPEISRFLGISIYMYYREHVPPHFHAEYGEYEAIVEIQSGVVSGKLPRRALNLVLDWCELHTTELLRDWELARREEPLVRIQPLE
jgi:hypothetical protein